VPADCATAPRSPLARFFAQEDLNFLLTNRVPRLALTRAMGRISRIRSPLFTRAAIALWRLFTELDLSDAKRQRFDSIHDCFTRELRANARAIDARPEILVSPCDAIVGACGRVERGQVFQAKGMPYAMADLFGPTQPAGEFEGGSFVTLRLTSAMYHRFHAPHDLTVEHVSYLSGDTWNVNPIALQRIERLFCRNERAVVRARLAKRSRWCRWRRSWWPACAFTSCRACRTRASAARPKRRAARRTPRARRWAGSSTARPSSCSCRRASRWPKASAAACACAWGRR
jgi:phosphatidylserine decarboxylase